MLIVGSDVAGQDCAGCDVDDVYVSLCAQSALECIVSGVSYGVRVCTYTLDFPQMYTYLNSPVGFQSQDIGKYTHTKQSFYVLCWNCGLRRGC